MAKKKKKVDKKKEIKKEFKKETEKKDYVVSKNQESMEIQIRGALSKEPSFLVNNFIKRGLKKYVSVESAIKDYKKIYKEEK